MEKTARSAFGPLPRPFALLCFLVLVTMSGCGNDFEDVHGTQAGEEAFAAPVPTSPPDGEEISASAPELTWFAVPSAVSFRVEISDHKDFETLEEVVEDIPATSFMISDFPINEGRHFWRVRAQNAAHEWSPWSTVSSFVVVSSTVETFKGEVPSSVSGDAPPAASARGEAAGPDEGAPEPIAPEDGFSTGEDAVDFSWGPARGAASYVLVILPAGQPTGRSTPVYGTSVRETGFEPGTYLWQVFAKNPQGVLGASSPPRAFTITGDPGPEDTGPDGMPEGPFRHLRSPRGDALPRSRALAAVLTARSPGDTGPPFRAGPPAGSSR
jgi:hypothetical protein